MALTRFQQSVSMAEVEFRTLNNMRSNHGNRLTIVFFSICIAGKIEKSVELKCKRIWPKKFACGWQKRFNICLNLCFASSVKHLQLLFRIAFSLFLLLLPLQTHTHRHHSLWCVCVCVVFAHSILSALCFSLIPRLANRLIHCAIALFPSYDIDFRMAWLCLSQRIASVCFFPLHFILLKCCWFFFLYKMVSKPVNWE